MHMLFLCKSARDIWYFSPLRLDSKTGEDLSFNHWCSSLLQINNRREWWDLFWSLLWGIWLKSNAWCFENKVLKIEDIITRAVYIVGEYEKANAKTPTDISIKQPPRHYWQATAMGCYMINSDAAIFRDSTAGLGGVVRDSVGDVVVATCKISGCLEVNVLEALAARHSISIALEAGFNKLILESDSLKLINYLKHSKFEHTSFGLIMRDILHLANFSTSIEYSHVGRLGNGVTHKLS
ncbi:uncharacterized protein LOC110686471 [Chenopodium quinoa]|uniref:uncharacterized protein LOC110686471 n=1 Tax=Chenopodium quinoa TaxID=63459 RepID=UPI000B798593|nr:uncharacterized protein LOC110686471 [Chenopodium quinoa]